MVNILPAKTGADLENNSSESERPFQLIVYPNPATNEITIDLNGLEGKVNTQVFDLTGKLMYAHNTAATNQLQLDIYSLPQGMYILRVMDEAGNVATIKWIKE